MLRVMHGYGIISLNRSNLLLPILHIMSALAIMNMTGLRNLGSPLGLQTSIMGRMLEANAEYHIASSSECLAILLSLLALGLLKPGISTTPLMQVLFILSTCPLKLISLKEVTNTTS